VGIGVRTCEQQALPHVDEARGSMACTSGKIDEREALIRTLQQIRRNLSAG
jgi:hypothetical protein